MKYLLAIMLFVTCPAIIAQTVHTTTAQTTSKIGTEIIASSSTTVVKNAPFSADAISESTQTLADGNKISRSFTTRMYRDSSGRFRREEMPDSNSADNNVPNSQQAVSIFDPVSNQRFLLNPTTKTARQVPVLPGMAESAVIVNGKSLSYAVKQQIETNAAQKTQVVVLPNIASNNAAFKGAGKSESLGVRDFEGVEAEGTRTVTTIAAGTIGNERPIEIIYERWYSKDLQLIVYSKYSDPRFGEQTYRLTNINRSEPDRSLFIPTSDYKVVAEPTFKVVTAKPL